MTLNRIVTLLVWIAVGASAAAWWWVVRGTASVDAAVPVAAESPVAPADWAVLLGTGRTSSPTVTDAAADAARYRLIGVAGPSKPGATSGVALMSVEGGPPRALRVGQPLDDRRVLLEIQGHEVRIGPPGGPVTLTLQAPLLPPPATGTLPAAPKS